MCVLACSLYHAGECNPSLARLSIAKELERHRFTITVCRHCEDPACFAACPADAMERDDRGVVSLVEEACVACGSCAAACPYDAISFHEGQGCYLKCDLCRGREGGAACIAVCPSGALVAGDGDAMEVKR